MLSTHYRKPMDWTEKKRDEAEATLRKWRALLLDAEVTGVPEAFIETLADDLNTPGAIAQLHAMAKEISANPQKDCFYEKGAFLASAQLLGLLTPELAAWADAAQVDLGAFASQIETLRTAAMQSKDFAAVDALKTALLGAGVEVKMSKSGVELTAGPKFDASKLEALT
jgi:cysteinyl-tRNA synthetase